MKMHVHLAAAVLAVSAATVSGTTMAAVSFPPPSCEPVAKDSSEAFGVRLLTAVSGSGTRNALVSPLGIGAVLEMVALGAKSPVRRSIREMFEAGDGGPEPTGAAVEGASAAGSNGDAPDGNGQARRLSCRLAWVLYDARDDGTMVQVANGAFADRRLDLFPAYTAVLRDRFGARVERLDFADGGSVGRINAWVSAATGGAIPHLISRLDPDDVLVLANAMRFEGEWAQPFEPERTAPAAFHLRTGAASEVPTMQADDLSARYREDEDFQAVALSYGGGRFEFVAVLPRAGLEAPEALRRLEADPSWLDRRGFRRARGALALPRLALTEEASLLPVLRALGLGVALADPQAFAGIAAPAPKLSRVLHRTKLVLDERGTEAAAATAAVMTTRTAMVEEEEERFEMRVDRPFALAVRHRRTGAVLFTAWVDDPLGGRQTPTRYSTPPGERISLVPEAPPPSQPPKATATPGGGTLDKVPLSSGDVARAYEAAERVGTVAAFQAVIAKFPGSIYAKLAQAQIDKLGKEPLKEKPLVVAGGDPEGEAAERGRAEVGQRFSERFGRPFSAEFRTGSVGWTDLHYAAVLDLPGVVAALCDAGMDADTRLKAGSEPFGENLKRRLAALGHEGFKGWKARGETPLMIAAAVNARKAAAGLVACGADVDATNSQGLTPLHRAARFNAPDMAKLLMDRGADVNAADERGQTPLYYAAWKNASEVAKLLIDRGADVNTNESDWAPLHVAARYKALDVAKLLIDRGADVNATKEDGDTPLHTAAADNALGMAKLLIDRGADVNATKEDGDTPLHTAAADNALGVAKLLIDRGADVNATTQNGNTPLHHTAWKNVPDVAKLLMDRGAAVNATNEDGETPLDRALKEDLSGMQALLRESGGTCRKRC